MDPITLRPLRVSFKTSPAVSRPPRTAWAPHTKSSLVDLIFSTELEQRLTCHDPLPIDNQICHVKYRRSHRDRALLCRSPTSNVVSSSPSLPWKVNPLKTTDGQICSNPSSRDHLRPPPSLTSLNYAANEPLQNPLTRSGVRTTHGSSTKSHLRLPSEPMNFCPGEPSVSSAMTQRRTAVRPRQSLRPTRPRSTETPSRLPLPLSPSLPLRKIRGESTNLVASNQRVWRSWPSPGRSHGLLNNPLYRRRIASHRCTGNEEEGSSRLMMSPAPSSTVTDPPPVSSQDVEFTAILWTI